MSSSLSEVRIAAVTVALAAISFAGTSRADAPWHEVDPLDLKTVPVVDLTPAPKFERVSRGGNDHDWVLAAAEHDKARPFAPPEGQRARYEEPMRGGNLSVIVNDNLDFPTRNGLMKFFQENPSAEAMSANCGLGPDVFQSVRSYALSHAADGGFVFTHRQAWFDYVPCKGELLRSYETKLTPIAGGLAFAYRTSCPRCEEGKRERLQVITPTALSLQTGTKEGEVVYWTFGTILSTFPIEPGKSTSFEAKFENSAITTWNRVLDKPLPTPPFTSLRIEFTRGEKDPLPIARVYTR